MQGKPFSEDQDEEDFILIPIFWTSVLTITNEGYFHQVLTYDYSESTGRYFNKIQSERDFYVNELRNIRVNMQNFLDDCPNWVNDEEVRPKVLDADIDFRSSSNPFFYWVIQFRGEFQEGINEYKSTIEEEKLEYAINSTYIFEPPLMPLDAKSKMNFDVDRKKRIIRYWASAGDIVGPTEIITFKQFWFFLELKKF